MIHMIEHRRTELLQGRVSKLHLGLDADSSHYLKPRCRLNRIVQQRSLADPGLATYDKRAALPGACPAEQLIQRCAFRETIKHHHSPHGTPAGGDREPRYKPSNSCR
jgi:hypothetical protein